MYVIFPEHVHCTRLRQGMGGGRKRPCVLLSINKKKKKRLPRPKVAICRQPVGVHRKSYNLVHSPELFFSSLFLPVALDSMEVQIYPSSNHPKIILAMMIAYELGMSLTRTKFRTLYHIRAGEGAI